ncbi:MAG: hypothetical protein GPJ51_01245 [Candidatus Heimdallarchaeota archaeon]|nr:hypothetical protein [Candidatus Heimdallarchaeota archaeon]
MDDETQKLFSLLDKAANEMIANSDQPTFSYFDTCEDVGLFIQDITNKAKNGELEEISKLWYIFAPTSVWDDSGGSQEIANEIFELINEKHKPE